MIKIVSGFSIPVGSVRALVNLCNQLNERGYECIFYGPDKWHLDKCQSAIISYFRPENGDIIIVHNIKVFSVAGLFEMSKVDHQSRNTKFHSIKEIIQKFFADSSKRRDFTLILSCQDNERFPIKKIKIALFDKIHYVHISQVNYHKVKQDHFICPNFYTPLIPSMRKPDKIAGVIGSIREDNKTDLCIEKAIEDGMRSVVLYGYLFDPIYYYKKIEPLTKKYPGKIKYAGFVDDQQKMYDSVSDVYCLRSKPWSKVRKECELTNTRYHGPDICQEDDSMSNDQIFNCWKNALGL